MKIKTLGLLLASIVFFFSCNHFGKELKYNNLQVFYKDGVSRDEASRLGDYLVKSGFNEDHTHVLTVQVVKKGDIYQFRMVAKKGVVDDPSYTKLFHQFASELSRDVFNNATVELHLCDDLLRTQRVFQMETIDDWEKHSGSNYEIRYPASWTLKEDASSASVFTITSPTTQSGKKAAVGLTIEERSQTVSIEEYMQYSLALLREANNVYENFNLIESKYDNSGAMEWGRIVYTARLGGTDLKFKQAFTIKNSRAYVISGVTAADETDEDLIKTAEDIMGTFTFTD